MGEFLLMQLHRRLGKGAELADIGDLGQPPSRGLIEMVQRFNGAAVEHAGLDREERAFHLPFGLGPPHSAGHRPEAIMRGEGQEPRVVDRHVILGATDDDPHLVIQAGRGHSPQMLEGPHVLAQSGDHVLGLDEAEVLPPRVAQDVAEQVDAAPAFAGEVDLVGGVIHLSRVQPV
jgi:hypothetical protein